MLHITGVIAGCLAGLVLALAVFQFVKATTVRILTGYWPHENAKAEALFRSLP